MGEFRHQKSDGRFKGYEGVSLYFQKWCVSEPLGRVLITHGHGEHSGSYHRVVEALSSLPLDIYSWDLRGHGKSEGQRGYASSFLDYCQDFERYLSEITFKKESLNPPLFLLAHSMGALIQERVLCENPQFSIKAQVLSSPLLGLSLPVPFYKSIGAKYLNILVPRLTLSNEIPNSDLSRDSLVLREYENDPLRHNQMSPGVYLGFTQAMSQVLDKAGSITVPTLLMMSESDPVISTKEALHFLQRMGSQEKKARLYPGFKHELFNDIGRDQVLSDLLEFIKDHLSK